MRVEISYKTTEQPLLTRSLIREFADDLSDFELRNAVLREIISDMGLVSYQFSYEK